MPSLSFDKRTGSRAIARVKGGEYDGEILYLHDDSTGGRKPKNSLDMTAMAKELPKMKPADRTRVMSKMADAYAKGEPKLTGLGDEVDDEGIFELLPSPDPKKREVWYIAGQSGSGKSYIAKGLADMYHKLYPERGVYLISKLKEDETLDKLKFLKRLNIQSFIDDYPDLEEFKDCMIIADDYDTLTGDAQKTIEKLIDDLAIMGRHTNTTMLCLSHYLTNYKKTRLLLNEATHIVVYPLSTSYHALRYLLKSYVGVDEDDLKRQRRYGSRWLSYAKGFPQFMISQKNAELLHQ